MTAPNEDREMERSPQITKSPEALELRHLRAFIAVAGELNFGRAAAQLYLSPPALSRQIRALEQIVGCELLRRTTHRVELTLAGNALQHRALEILAQVDEAVSATRLVGGELVARIARYWEPVGDLIDAELQALRMAFEDLHAQFSPPQDVAVRPINAGGVPSLLLTPPQPATGTVLYLHGGAYISGSAFGYQALAGALAAAANTRTLLPDYRLAPEYPFPAAVEDALRAYLWLVEGGTDPEQILLAGDSSGAHLVLSTLIGIKNRQLPAPVGAVLLCPGVDLAGSRPGEQPTEPQPATAERLRQRFVTDYLAGHPHDDPMVDPLGTDLSDLPPILIQAGTGDTLLADAHRLVEHARRCDVAVTLQLYPVATHDFHIFWSFLPEAAEALRHAGQFIATTTQRGAATESRPEEQSA
ncbi:alpha/beta hydrolase fold domain-containing protein [Nocardia sp. NPDC004123]